MWLFPAILLVLSLIGISVGIQREMNRPLPAPACVLLPVGLALAFLGFLLTIFGVLGFIPYIAGMVMVAAAGVKMCRSISKAEKV